MADPLRTPLPPPPPPPPGDDEDLQYQYGGQQEVYEQQGTPYTSPDNGSYYEQGSPPPPAPRVVILEQLGDVEKELYFQFLLENDVQFTKVEDDCYVANVRMLIQKDKAQEQTPEAKAKEMLKKRNKEKMAKLAMATSANL